MKLSSIILISTLALSGCCTTATGSETANTEVALVQPNTPFGAKASDIFRQSCNLTSNDIREVRNWFVANGEGAVDEAIKLHEEIIRVKARAETEEFPSDRYVVIQEKADIVADSYKAYISELNSIFDGAPPKTNNGEMVYNQRRAKVVTDLAEWEKSLGGDTSEFLATAIAIFKFIMPTIKNAYSNACVAQLKNELKEQKARLVPIASVDLSGLEFKD